jgi:hypothetical protein
MILRSIKANKMFSQSIPNNAGAARKITLLSILQISLPLTVLVYCAGFHYSYVNWVSPVWAYEGLTYASPPPVLLVLAYALATLLAVVSPPRLLKPSHAAYWILLFMVYIPGIFVPLFLRLVGEPALLALQLGLTGGMLVIAFSFWLPSLNFRRYPLDSKLFWGIFTAIYLIGNAMMIVVYRNNIHFASLQTMYSVRHESSKVLVQNPVTGYISQLLANVLNPLLMVYGLAKRKKKLTFIGIAGQMLLFGIFANKLTLLSPIVIAALYYTIKNDWGGWVPKMNLFLAGVFFSLTTLVIGAGSGFLFNLATVAIVRNFAIPGMLVGQYQYFFENQPHTYLGTVTGLNLFVTNAYTLPVGVEVSAFYGAKEDSERGRANGNANLFATDGIAAFGLWGIPIAGALCAIVLWVLDGCAKNYAIELSVSATTMLIYSFTNVSVFTTLLGNGLIAWMLLFIFMPRSFSDLTVVRTV